MNATDFLLLLPIFATAFFLLLGERLKDNIYRTFAGILGLLSAAIPGYPVGMIFASAVLAVYVAAMWFFQPTIRASKEA